MVFVHARKETVKTGLTIHEMASKEGITEEFDCSGNPRWEFFKKDLSMSKNKEMKQLFDCGIGIHHAGMLRSDRNLTERMFESGSLKVSFASFDLLEFSVRRLNERADLPFSQPFCSGSLLHCYARLGSQSSRSCRCVDLLPFLSFFP